uniref:SEt domain-containing protein n=1 Tax=Borely moumouvirus TaxID=2712067 RepID=A0A6G6ABR9_9VIRU
MSKNKNSDKIYIKESTIFDGGKGLFAKKNIKINTVIGEYKGRFCQTTSQIKNSRSIIYFNDNTFLECSQDNLVSYANDCINFLGKPRKIIEALETDKPFYFKHVNTIINSTIKINTKLHRAFLISTTEIPINQEIFCHYGFSYWYDLEIRKIGFLQEEKINQIGFPKEIFRYPAFRKYIEEFYPDCDDIEIKLAGKDHNIILHFGPDQHIVIVLKNYSDFYNN